MVLLVSMACKFCVAICKPLHYSSIMNTQTCIRLVMTSWIIGFVHSISQLAIVLQLPFCGPRELDSFFCDIPFGDQARLHGHLCLEMLINADSGVLATICFILLLWITLIFCLLSAISRRDGASKALSTCCPRTVVVLFFGPCIFIYLFPLNILGWTSFLLYFMQPSHLNPVIYTLKQRH